MRHALWIALATSAAMSTQARGLQPTIEEKLLSPLAQGFTYVPSPAPVDLVTVGPAGSRMAVYRDAEPGPKFDEILTTQPTPEGGGGIAVVFSPDGSRYAYVGRKREEFSLIVDGEEALTGKYDRGNNVITGIGFTTDNKLFYRLRQQDDNADAPWHFVMDSKPTPPLAHDQIQILRSPVGTGYTLLAKRFGTHEPVFIRDGEVAESAATNFVYSPDGRLFTLEHDTESNETILKRDNEELYRSADPVQKIVPAPAGDNWALVVSERSRGANTIIVVNGTKHDDHVSGTMDADRIWFSDDGQHWAAIIQPQTGRQYVLLDGETQDEYQSIQELSFSPSGDRHAYWGRSPTGAYLVIDAEEQDGVSSQTRPVVWGGEGDHIGWAEQASAPPRLSALYDGARYVGSNNLAWGNIGLSPDGKRMAVLDGPTLVEFTPDGITTHEGFQNQVRAKGSTAHGGYLPMPTGFTFSPDSRLLVAWGNDLTTGKKGVFINSQLAFEAPGNAVLRIGFSPDSKHLYLLVGVTGSERMLYVDGEPIMRLGPQPFEAEESMWHVDDAGLLHFMIADNEGIKRITVTPSPDRTINDLVAD